METQRQSSWWIYTLDFFEIGIYSILELEIGRLQFRYICLVETAKKFCRVVIFYDLPTHMRIPITPYSL